MAKAIEIEHLKKYYKEVKAVDDISFTVEEGEFFAFLGVNGAGKSTTISVLSGKEARDGGKVLVAGYDPDSQSAQVKRRLGVVFQESVLDKALTVAENLRYRASLYGLYGEAYKRKLDFLVQAFALEDLLKRPFGKLSGGQRRRTDIARALLNDPQILVLDEPTTGLDPQTRKAVWEAVHTLRRERNLTVFLTTHYMEEAADADRVVILDGGKILADATPLELKNRYTGDYITLYHASKEELETLAVPYETFGEGVRIAVKDTAEATKLIVAHADVFRDYEITKGKMDDVFLAVTGKRIGGEL